MSRTSLYIFLIVLVGCASRPTSNDETVLPPSTRVSPPPSGEVAAPNEVDASEVEPASVEGTQLTADSSLYIGEIWTFPETGELYTPLFYHEDIDHRQVDQWLQKQTDSLIYEDSEATRTRLPLAIARKYLNFAGLDTISVFEKGRLACKARLVRVEYLDGLIQIQFIAVFKPLRSVPLPEHPDYCLSSGKNPFKSVDVSYEDIEDKALTKQLLGKFAAGASPVWHVSHTRVMPYNTVYSAMSFESRLLLVETSNGQSRVLHDENKNTSTTEIIPTHLEENGRPVLLLRMAVNETDIMWTAVGIYSGKDYVIQDRNRVVVSDR